MKKLLIVLITVCLFSCKPEGIISNEEMAGDYEMEFVALANNGGQKPDIKAVPVYKFDAEGNYYLNVTGVDMAVKERTGTFLIEGNQLTLQSIIDEEVRSEKYELILLPEEGNYQIKNNLGTFNLIRKKN